MVPTETDICLVGWLSLLKICSLHHSYVHSSLVILEVIQEML